MVDNHSNHNDTNHLIHIKLYNTRRIMMEADGILGQRSYIQFVITLFTVYEFFLINITFNSISVLFCWKKLDYQEKTTKLLQVTDKSLPHEILHISMGLNQFKYSMSSNYSQTCPRSHLYLSSHLHQMVTFFLSCP